MDLQLPTTSPLHNTCFSIFIGEYIDVVIGSYWLVTGSVYTVFCIIQTYILVRQMPIVKTHVSGVACQSLVQSTNA